MDAYEEADAASAGGRDSPGTYSQLSDVRSDDNDDEDFTGAGSDDDWEELGASHAKKSIRSKPDKRVRNDVTKKLRSAAADEEQNPDEEQENTPADGAYAEEDAGFGVQHEAVFERKVSEEESAEQLDTVRNMWEWAVVLHFLEMFSDQLRMNELPMTGDALAEALVHDTGSPDGLLARLHLKILHGMTSSSNLSATTWQSFLAYRLKYDRQNCTGVHRIPEFYPRRGYEADDYCKLDTCDRVKALKALCEIRLLQPDIHDTIDETLQPKKKQKTEAKATAGLNRRELKAQRSRTPEPQRSIDDFRLQPLITMRDKGGCSYWLLHCVRTTGCWLFKEGPPLPFQVLMKPPPEVKKGKKGAKNSAQAPSSTQEPKYFRPPHPEAPDWELLAVNLEELQETAEKLVKSRVKLERELSELLQSVVIPDLISRREQAEKQKKCLARAARALGLDKNVLMDSGRSARTRKKTVNYAYDDYDKELNDAIRRAERRGGGGSGVDRSPSPPAQPRKGTRTGLRSRIDEPFPEDDFNLPTTHTPSDAPETKQQESNMDDHNEGGERSHPAQRDASYMEGDEQAHKQASYMEGDEQSHRGASYMGDNEQSHRGVQQSNRQASYIEGSQPTNPQYSHPPPQQPPHQPRIVLKSSAGTTAPQHVQPAQALPQHTAHHTHYQLPQHTQQGPVMRAMSSTARPPVVTHIMRSSDGSVQTSVNQAPFSAHSQHAMLPTQFPQAMHMQTTHAAHPAQHTTTPQQQQQQVPLLNGMQTTYAAHPTQHATAPQQQQQQQVPLPNGMQFQLPPGLGQLPDSSMNPLLYAQNNPYAMFQAGYNMGGNHTQ